MAQPWELAGKCCSSPSEPGGPRLTDWAKADFDNIFTTNASRSGWCNVVPADAYASKVKFKEDCDCKYDGLWGRFCEVPVSCTCINQCFGHGHCWGGFCQVFIVVSCNWGEIFGLPVPGEYFLSSLWEIYLFFSCILLRQVISFLLLSPILQRLCIFCHSFLWLNHILWKQWMDKFHTLHLKIFVISTYFVNKNVRSNTN